ncbi:hypothetical protein VULLAG_LOCUS5476 [Vulpes lagopus]
MLVRQELRVTPRFLAEQPGRCQGRGRGLRVPAAGDQLGHTMLRGQCGALHPSGRPGDTVVTPPTSAHCPWRCGPTGLPPFRLPEPQQSRDLATCAFPPTA